MRKKEIAKQMRKWENEKKSHSGRSRRTHTYTEAYSDISIHNQAYSGIFRDYSDILLNPV